MANTPSTKRFEALQIRDFRLFWMGQGVSSIGTEMQRFAIPLHIYTILAGQTVDVNLFGWELNLDLGTLGLGTVGLVRVIPIMLFALLGGMLADVIERRKLLIWAEGVSALLAASLALVTFSG